MERKIRNKLVAFAAGALMATPLLATANLNIADVPLAVSTNNRPNVLLILDNSSTQVEALDGSAAGSTSDESKTEIARSVARQLVSSYAGRINMGLMAYQQHPPNTGNNHPGNVILWELHNRQYDVSYDSDDHDEDFSGAPWDSQTKRYEVKDSSPAVYYNVQVPGYSSTQDTEYCYHRTDWGSPGTNLFRFRCFSRKVNSSNAIPTDANWGRGDRSPGETAAGYRGNPSHRNMRLGDSPIARGVMSFGDRMTVHPLGQKEWVSSGSPGLGYLHVPIRELNAAQQAALNKKLAVTDLTYAANATTDPERPLISAGLTPIEGTLLTARDYFSGQNTYFKSAQGRRSDLPALPQSCDNDFAIWLTDGMPSVDKDGNALGDTDAALEQAKTSAEALHGAGVELYVVGFAMPPMVAADTLDQLARAGGTERGYMANNYASLSATLNEIFSDIIERSVGTVSIASNTTRLDGDTAIYQARLNSTDWSGDLLAYSVTDSGRIGSRQWNAADWIPAAAARNIITNTGSASAIAFEWSDALSEAQRSALTGDVPEDEVEAVGKARVQWLRGDRSGEDGVKLRQRADGVLGHIANSDPVFVPGEAGGRRPMVYVAANDGMLHGFDAETGVERLAFIPKSIYPRLRALTQPGYRGSYVLDGSPVVARVRQSGEDDRFILVGSTGAAGRSVFALDVSDPQGFDEESFLWEFTHEELGYTIGKPAIAKLRGNRWVAIFGNGYNSKSGRAQLFVVDLLTGAELAKIDTSIGDGNGLGAPTVHDYFRNGVVDRVYAGDLKGNLWRFDIGFESTDDWGLGPRAPLFNARDGSGGNAKVQPVTAAPAVGVHPNGTDRLIYFGTGEYFQIGAATDTSLQSFYAVRDREADTGSGQGVRRSDLRQQRILAESGDWRATSDHTSKEDGWFLDLESPVNGKQGERVISKPLLRRGQVIFSTLIPTDDPCSAGGYGYLMVLDAFTGARPERPVFDDEAVVEVGEDEVPASGMRRDSVMKTPTPIDNRGRDLIFTDTDDPIVKPSRSLRQYWRQMQ